MCKGQPPCEEIIEVRGLVRETHATTKRLEKLLTGNGEPSKGMVVRVDRLEQAEGRRSFITKTLIGAWVAAVAGSVWAWVRAKG